MDYSIVRDNLLSKKGYTPYCGALGKCDMPRIYFDKTLNQFVCPHCGWVSQYPKEFIEEYKKTWNL